MDSLPKAPQLCVDGTCIGMVGPDGACKICNTLAESSPRISSKLPLTKKNLAQEEELRYRSLCPDGSCVGVMGHDGACKVCGHIGQAVLSDPRLRGLTPPPPNLANIPDKKLEEKSPKVKPNKSIDFEKRTLCSDGSCLGILDNHGECKICHT